MINLTDKAYATEVNFGNLNETLKGLLGSSWQNPGAELNDTYDFIVRILHYFLNVAGVLAFIMIIWASILYLTSYGDDSKIESAKKTLIWTVVGMLLIMFSKVILILVYNAANKT